jgi:hypothetical protein
LLRYVPWVSRILVESFVVGILSSASGKHRPIWKSLRALVIVKLIAGRPLWWDMILQSSNNMVSRFS